ncbi:FAD-binding oxidoreductase [Shinella sp. PSBB067]|uniref:FAD-binding oxidoreductase n=1 Tax=Shinella sp. PSBB067 TaxID=2715959 RepID=UPI00193B9075|nr:FAD-binding oxidoreductase [Shinella sp. PSBB067]QRI62394.1 FAD-binding oxidoreductase [Shinella sp. PSBB067]
MVDLDDVRRIVGERHVVDGAALSGRPQDFWVHTPTAALGLAKPKDVQELSALLALCHQEGQPVIVEGGRTNLVGATQSTGETLLVSLERLNDIAAPDRQGMTVEVGAGAIIETIQQRCATDGLRFGLDFGARGSATLGGALSTNAGGFQALRYGVARDQVLGLECVLADGTVLSHLSSFVKDNTGYDLKHLFIGSEGTLGVITRAVLRLHPAPQSVNTALLAFETFEAVAETLGLMRRDLNGTLSSFEIMWAEFFHFNVDAVLNSRSPIEGRYPFYILCESEGFEAEADAALFETVVGRAIEDGLVADAVIAASSRQRQELWRIREDFEAEMQLFKTMIDFDVSLPVASMEAFVSEVERRLNEEVPGNLGLHVLGHLGDGNLHVTTGLATPEGKGEVRRLVYELISGYGGSISAEHGIGLAKRDYLHHSRTAAEIATMRVLKQALDPKGILNPGKVI